MLDRIRFLSRLAWPLVLLACMLCGWATVNYWVGIRHNQVEHGLWARDVGHAMATLTPPLRDDKPVADAPSLDFRYSDPKPVFRRFWVTRVLIPLGLGLLAGVLGFSFLRKNSGQSKSPA